ncbi:hypothetical protein CFC21_087983 [Triticum aestivum]|uniref:SHSP domain-containing protein n=3 Tax=Triticum aestivum TaxID=4565 RepID=A0A9R1IHP0_WHEAT|nr:hypothetical protein CFC21_087983 [Triticum aestivum]
MPLLTSFVRCRFIMQPVSVCSSRATKEQSDEEHTATHRAEFVTGHMALSRLCLKKALAGRAAAMARPASASSHGGMSLFSAAADSAATRAPLEGETNRREVAVADRSSSATARGGRWPWRDLRDFVPFRLVNGLGSALSHVAETLSRPLERWRPLFGKVREDEERYRLRFEVPGLGKDDVRVTVEDGALVIRGEKRVEDEHGGDGEWWSASSYGYYHASLLLPEDARVDGIAAEVKDGVLYVTVPRVPGRERSVTEVKVQ